MDEACGEYVTVPAAGKQPPRPAYERGVNLAGRILGWCFRIAVLNAVVYGLAHAVPRVRDERRELAFFTGAYAVLAAWLRRLRHARPEDSQSPTPLGIGGALAGSPALAVLFWCVSVAVLFAGLYVAVFCFRKDQQQYQALGDIHDDGDDSGGGVEGKAAVEKIASADEMV
ncbi:hypothetical protein EJB05_33172, partial [Eragrostis curvula]